MSSRVKEVREVQGVQTSINKHQQNTIQKAPMRTNIRQQGASTNINRPQQMLMNTTKSQHRTPTKHGKNNNEHQQSTAIKLFEIPIELNKLMLIATMTKQAKNKNLSSKLHVLELLITLFYMENEKGEEKKKVATLPLRHRWKPKNKNKNKTLLAISNFCNK